MTPIEPEQRCSTSRPCQVCGGSPDDPRGVGQRCYGFVSVHGTIANCTREEYAGKLHQNETSGTYRHNLDRPCPCGQKHDGTLHQPTNQRHRGPEPGCGEPSQVYLYKDVHGTLAFQVCRYPDKRFAVRRPCDRCGGPVSIGGRGPTESCNADLNSDDLRDRRRRCRDGFIWNRGDVPAIPYRLPELIDALDAGETIYVCEGEKDVDALVEVGLVATTNPFGAGKWLPRFAEYFAGASVVVFADKDEKGYGHAADVRQSLASVAKSVRVVEAKEGKDASDHLAAGFSVADAVTVNPDDLCSDSREGLPEISVGFDIQKNVDEALDVLRGDDRLFEMGAAIVQITRESERPKYVMRPRGAPSPRRVQTPSLREILSARASWLAHAGDDAKHCLPPSHVVGALSARGQYPMLRSLEMVTEAPVLLPNGEVLVERGYHPDSGILLEPSSPAPELPDRPSLDDARTALAVIHDLIGDFMFVDPAHRSSAVSALLTLSARPAIDGVVPLVLVEGSTPGAGKGLLCSVFSEIGIGRGASTMVLPARDEEMSKTILAIALAGERFILIDNIAVEIRHPSFDAALTSRTWSGRVLGETQFVKNVPLNVVWFATANNASIRADTYRRTLPVRLTSTVEHPHERTGFQYPALLGHVRQRRTHYQRAVLTILRAYFVAGCPKQSIPSWGSFEAWSDLIRQCMVWVGEPDPYETHVALRDLIDVEADAEARLLRGLLSLYPAEDSFTAADAIRDVKSTHEDNEDLASAMVEVCRKAKRLDDVTANQLGNRLRSMRDRIRDGMKVDSLPGNDKRGNLWVVRRVGGPTHPCGPRGGDSKARDDRHDQAADVRESQGGAGESRDGAGSEPASSEDVTDPESCVHSALSSRPQPADEGCAGVKDGPLTPHSPPAPESSPASPPSPSAGSGRPASPASTPEASSASPSSPPPSTPGSDVRWGDYDYVRDLAAARDAILRLVASLAEGGVVGIDFETTGLDPLVARPRLLQLAVPSTPVVIVDLFDVPLAGVADLLVDLPLVAHNAMFEMQFLRHHGGVRVTPQCTQLAEHALSGKRRSLQEIAREHLGLDLDKNEQRGDWATPELTASQLQYAAIDAQVLPTLLAALLSKIDNTGARRSYDLAVGAQPAVVSMLLAGVPFDAEAHGLLVEHLEGQAADLERQLDGALPGVKVTSNKQLAEWIGEQLGGPGTAARAMWPRAPKGGLRTGKEELQAHLNLLPTDAVEIVEKAVLPFREVKNQLGKYGSKLADRLHSETGRIYCNLHIAGAPTGRMSSSEPNMQAIPRDARFRALFRAGEGRQLIAADYSQMELRVMALLSGDPKLLQAYAEGADFHLETAARLLGKPAEAVTATERGLAKSISLGMIFGQGPSALRDDARKLGLTISEGDARSFQERWFGLHPRVAAWRRARERDLSEHGAVRTLGGRVRQLGGRDVPEAYNTPVQGTAAEVLFAALAHLDDLLQRAEIDAVPVLTVHDEILLEASEADADVAAKILEKAMVLGMLDLFPDAATNGLVEVKIGRNWAEAK